MSDHLHDEIRGLILQTDSPRDKAMLLVLLRISETLERNTLLTESLDGKVSTQDAKLQDHEKREEALINQGRGFWRAVVISIAIFQAIIAWIGMRHVQAFDSMVSSQGEIATRLTRLEEWRKTVDGASAQHKDAPQ